MKIYNMINKKRFKPKVTNFFKWKYSNKFYIIIRNDIFHNKFDYDLKYVNENDDK